MFSSCSSVYHDRPGVLASLRQTARTASLISPQGATYPQNAKGTAFQRKAVLVNTSGRLVLATSYIRSKTRKETAIQETYPPSTHDSWRRKRSDRAIIVALFGTDMRSSQHTCPDYPLTKKPTQRGFAEVTRILHHVQSLYPI